MVGHYPSLDEALGLIPTQHQSSVVVTEPCNLSAQEAEAGGGGGGSETQSHSWLHKELKATKRKMKPIPLSPVSYPEDQFSIVLSGDVYNGDTPRQK